MEEILKKIEEYQDARDLSDYKFWELKQALIRAGVIIETSPPTTNQPTPSPQNTSENPYAPEL
jgi:hypothetical protein